MASEGVAATTPAATTTEHAAEMAIVARTRLVLRLRVTAHLREERVERDQTPCGAARQVNKWPVVSRR
jgi:hypothetical protein